MFTNMRRGQQGKAARSYQRVIIGEGSQAAKLCANQMKFFRVLQHYSILYRAQYPGRKNTKVEKN